MKKIFLLLFISIIAIILFAGLAPRLLSFKVAQQTVAEELGRNLKSRIKVDNMQWSWLPLPHLSLINANLTNKYARCSLPHINIFPDWRMIFSKSLALGKIQLENPEILIVDVPTNKEEISRSGEAERPSLPILNLAISNGKLRIVTPEKYRHTLRDDIIVFTNITGSVKIVALQATLKFKASSPFSRTMTLQGLFNGQKKSYKLILETREISLHRIIKSLYGGNLTPAAGTTSKLTISVAGTGLQDMKASLKGELPGFLIKRNGHEELLGTADADLAFEKTDSLIRFIINDIEMQEPMLRLSGSVEKKFLREKSGTESEATDPNPIWTLDLKGSDLNLTAIREKVLNLLGDSYTAKTVCDVVRGGRAVSGAYRFSGRTADFRNLDTMTIEADVLEADIHVPEAKLDLTKASGPIMIKDSYLTGNGLSATLGNSYGSNGKLRLDLSGRNSTFSLDIDINADLADLPPVLEQLVHNDVFQRELHKFTNVSGRASANLKLGETLHNINTRVDVTDMQFSTGYALLPQTVFIDKGSLHVAPKEVSWQNIRGRTGLHQIISTSGSVSWQSGDVMLQLEDTEGQIDAASLLEVLEQIGPARNEIEKRLTALRGTLEVSTGMMHGPAAKPAEWEYLFTVNSVDLAFSSPLLPEPVTSGKLTATVSNREINIQQAEIKFLDQPVALKGIFTHKILQNWQGTVSFNGTLQKKLGAWLDSKGWLSKKFRPNIPCRVENLTVRFKGATTAVSGLILPGLSGARLPLASIDLENTPEHFRINNLTFYAPGEQGSLTFDYQRETPQGLVLSWEGFVTAETIATLFDNSIFASGSFAGAFFEITYFVGQPGLTRFKGLLKAENLLLKKQNKVSPIFIDKIIMNGIDKELKIATLGLAIGTEQITGRGRVTAEQKGLQLDIDIESPHLSDNSISTLTQAVEDNKNILTSASPEEKNNILLLKDWDITGDIVFSLDSYSFSHSTMIPYSGLMKHVSYTFNDVKGDMKLSPESVIKTEIFSARLCGLDFKGSWNSDKNSPQNFQLSTPPEGAFYLENVLPCLGVEQDLAEGEFSLLANLEKKSGTWQNGNIYLESSHGRILRLQTLSRIFRVVNVTDLFEEQMESAGKRGFPYTQMVFDTHIDADNLIFDRGIIRGQGLNLFLHGDIDLGDFDVDMTLLIAPLKTFDTIISKVPVIGQPVMDKYEGVVTIPVAVSGPIGNPVITPLHPSAVSNKILNIVKDTLMMPYTILKQE